MSDNTEDDYILTPVARLAFPHLFEKDMREINGKAVDKYTATLLFSKDEDLEPLKAVARRAIAEKWPNKERRPRDLKTPFRDGDVDGIGSEGTPWDGFPGTIFIRVSTKFQPGIVDQKVRPLTDPNKIYAGCYVRAQVHAYGYDNMGNRGVSFGLDNVQFVRDGEKIGGGGGIDPTAAFDAVAGGEADTGIDDGEEDDPLAM